MLCEGQLFYSFKALQHAVEEWALKENFTTRTPLKDNKRVEYRCYQHASHGCPFRIFATWKNEAVGIRKLEPLHTCFAVATPKYSHVNTQEWLQREVPKLLRVTKETTPKQIVEAVQFRYGETVQYQAALDCRNALAGSSGAAHALQFFYLPAYLDALRAYRPWCYTDLTTLPSPTPENPLKRVFQRVFICPHESQLAFKESQKIVAVDGTFLKAFFKETLLLACGVDANGQYILYAWAIVESENTDAWRYFFLHLKRAIPQILDASIISDRDKGLHSAEDVLGPAVTRLLCLEHLRRNFEKNGYREFEVNFWVIARSENLAAYERNMATLRNRNASAAEYLSKINPAWWVDGLIPGGVSRRCAQRTSNAVENLNNMLKGLRELGILQLLDGLWISYAFFFFFPW
jgi:hypothetical protein